VGGYGSADKYREQFGVAPVPERILVHSGMLRVSGIC
jgi:hypothetical protein